MRYVVAVIVLIGTGIVLTGVAVAGPDALSIAKRALALAKEPPSVTYVVAESPYLVEPDAGVASYLAVCPRGTVVINARTDFGAEADWNHRRAWATRPSRELGNFGPPKALTAVCIEARYAGTLAG